MPYILAVMTDALQLALLCLFSKHLQAKKVLLKKIILVSTINDPMQVPNDDFRVLVVLYEQ